LKRQIIIEFYPWETRVGIVEDGRLAEAFWENPQARVGKIYKGTVRDIVPGLSCAFVDIGVERNAFLYVGDIPEARLSPRAKIQDILKSGQEIMVQVKKEASAGKGARVTQELAIPGRYLVLLPNQEGVFISRKITDSQRRNELRQLLEKKRPPNMGAIVRTSSEEASGEEIQAELAELLRTWTVINENFQKTRSPGVIYEDVELVMRSLRDYLDNDTQAVIVNDAGQKKRLEGFMRERKPSLAFLVRHEPGDLFARYGLDKELKRALQRKVWLKHGGYLVIDVTEAMTIIDVNSGKFTGQSDFEDTVIKTNLDAAREIPRQLRLRRIGGIILVDFIDMKQKEDQDQVIQCLREELQKDKSHTRVLGLTRLGLLEMTRKKSRYGLQALFTEECYLCQGRGRVYSRDVLVNEIRRTLFNMDYLESDRLTCYAPLDIISRLEEDGETLQFIEAKLGKTLRLVAEPSLAPADYRIIPG